MRTERILLRQEMNGDLTVRIDRCAQVVLDELAPEMECAGIDGLDARGRHARPVEAREHYDGQQEDDQSRHRDRPPLLEAGRDFGATRVTLRDGHWSSPRGKKARK